MLEDLLDEGLIERRIIEKRGLANWSAFMLLWVGIGVSIAAGYLTHWPLLIGGAALIVTTFLFYLQKIQIAIMLLACSLLAGTLRILMFFPIYFTFDFGSVLSVDILPFLVLVLLLATNWETYRDLVVAIRGDHQETAADSRAAKNNRFLVAFRNKSTRELEAIVSENRLVPEAVQAAAELLKVRGELS
jgi:hypothetical protein